MLSCPLLAAKMAAAVTNLKGLLGEVDVLDGEQAGAEDGHGPVPRDGAARRRHRVCHEGQRTRREQHHVGVVLRVEEPDLRGEGGDAERIGWHGELRCGSSKTMKISLC